MPLKKKPIRDIGNLERFVKSRLRNEFQGHRVYRSNGNAKDDEIAKLVRDRHQAGYHSRTVPHFGDQVFRPDSLPQEKIEDPAEVQQRERELILDYLAEGHNLKTIARWYDLTIEKLKDKYGPFEEPSSPQ